MKRKSHMSGVFMAVILIVIAVSIIGIFALLERIINHVQVPDMDPGYTDSGDSRVFYDGQWYELNDSVETILVLGIDSIEAADGTESSSAQADFLAVLVMDRAEDTFRILHINRDTMTDITQIDAYGKKFGVFHAQIALSHAYGSAGKMQCRNTVDAVENLLYGVKMDHYISLTMDSVPILNDSLGGVRLTLADDFTVLGDEYLSGKEITLRGDQALTFVRWRSDDPTNSNLERMERQRQYIGALFSQYTSADTVDTLETMFRVNEYLVSDCTVDQLSTLIERVRDYRFDGTITLPGEIQKGDVYMEYHVDEPAAQKMIIDLFYKPEE